MNVVRDSYCKVGILIVKWVSSFYKGSMVCDLHSVLRCVLNIVYYVCVQVFRVFFVVYELCFLM